MISLLSGFLLPFQSIKILYQPGVRLYVIFPLLLNIGLFALLLWLAVSYFGIFMDTYLPVDTWFDYIRPLVWFLFAILYSLGMIYSFTIIANILAAPFNAILSLRIEEYLTGRRFSQLSMNTWLETIKNTLFSEFNKLFYFVVRMIPLFLLFLVALFFPGLNLLVSILSIAFGFWFLALEYMDYPMANHDIKPQIQRKLLAQDRLKSLGFGMGVSAMLLIPVVGFIAMPSAVAGATRFWHLNLREKALADFNLT